MYHTWKNKLFLLGFIQLVFFDRDSGVKLVFRMAYFANGIVILSLTVSNNSEERHWHWAWLVKVIVIIITICLFVKKLTDATYTSFTWSSKHQANIKQMYSKYTCTTCALIAQCLLDVYSTFAWRLLHICFV